MRAGRIASKGTLAVLFDPDTLRLTQVAHDIHISVSLLSLVERGQVDRPELEKLMRRYLAGIAKATR